MESRERGGMREQINCSKYNNYCALKGYVNLYDEERSTLYDT
jgi:hypothetical protein